LGASFSEIELVIAGYGLTYAVCLITGGRLGDIYGRKITFILGMAGFTLTSALCGLAPTAGWLIFSRLVQGCAAAVMFPQALSFIQVNFIGSSKRVAFSLYGAMIGFGSIVGQLLGGFLIHANLFQLGWRPIFLINLPIGILTIISASYVLRESRAQAAPSLDLGGVGILTVGLALFSYPFMEGQERGWPLWAWVSLIASFPVLWGFWAFECRQSLRNRSPLIEPRLFRDKGFVVGLLVTCIYFAGHSSMILVLSLYLQYSLRLNPMYAGFALVPFSFAFLLGSSISGKINGYLGRRSLHLGVVVLAILGDAGSTCSWSLDSQLRLGLFHLWTGPRNRDIPALQHGPEWHPAQRRGRSFWSDFDNAAAGKLRWHCANRCRRLRDDSQNWSHSCRLRPRICRFLADQPRDARRGGRPDLSDPEKPGSRSAGGRARSGRRVKRRRFSPPAVPVLKKTDLGQGTPDALGLPPGREPRRFSLPGSTSGLLSMLEKPDDSPHRSD